ncbi:hypothetical protein TNCT_344821 [Trichonephila clavata]|uniref:Uncharacterized protein n=1 Tax=Trichonephila clavata TaxID=2740835 RepID=A0A8X6KTS2_TRICU|nr:hypothetical protein TNCT_344821 [Trichonephila clavata]
MSQRPDNLFSDLNQSQFLHSSNFSIVVGTTCPNNPIKAEVLKANLCISISIRTGGRAIGVHMKSVRFRKSVSNSDQSGNLQFCLSVGFLTDQQN